MGGGFIAVNLMPATRTPVDSLGVTFWYAVFMLCSVGMTVGNKLVMRSLRTPYCVLLLQTLASVGMNCVLSWQGPSSPFHIRPFTLLQAKRLAVVSLNFTVMLGSSLKALPLVAVSTIVVARNLCTVLVAAGEFAFLGQRFTSHQLIALVVTLVGSIVYAFNDITFSAEGYFWQGVNSACFVFGQLYEKWNITKTEQTPSGVAQMKSMLSIPIIAMLIMAFDEAQNVHFWAEQPSSVWAVLALTCIGGCGMGVIYMSLYSISSATSVSVGGNANKVVSIVVASYMFNTQLGFNQVIGLSVCLVGSIWYSSATIVARAQAKCQKHVTKID